MPRRDSGKQRISDLQFVFVVSLIKEVCPAEDFTMAIKYSNKFHIRLTDDDRREIEKVSNRVELPASTLARKVLREWLQSELNLEVQEKTR